MLAHTTMRRVRQGRDAHHEGGERSLARLEQDIAAILAAAQGAGGHLRPREARFLALAALTVRAQGTIVEIGSYKGRSTVLLAHAARRAGRAGVVAIDPLTSETVAATAALTATQPEHVRAAFERNLDAAGVSADVELIPRTSLEVATSWSRPIRLLWIDGDHSNDGALRDVLAFTPFLSDGAVLAMHDVLNPFEGPVLAFAEHVLGSEWFASFGFCGSIAWAVRTSDREQSRAFATAKAEYRRKLMPLVRMTRGGRPRGLARILYKLARWRIPHGNVDVGTWLERMDGLCRR